MQEAIVAALVTDSAVGAQRPKFSWQKKQFNDGNASRNISYRCEKLQQVSERAAVRGNMSLFGRLASLCQLSSPRCQATSCQAEQERMALYMKAGRDFLFLST